MEIDTNMGFGEKQDIFHKKRAGIWARAAWCRKWDCDSLRSLA